MKYHEIPLIKTMRKLGDIRNFVTSKMTVTNREHNITVSSKASNCGGQSIQ